MTDQLVLQFSTTSPDWRKFAPDFLKHSFPLGLLCDKNWASPLIRRLCHSPFSHVDIMLPDGNLLGASGSPDSPVIATLPAGNASGVAVRPPNYQQFGTRRRMIIETDRAEDIRRICLTQLGKPFDNSALKEFLSDKQPGARDWRLGDSWFCAELAAWGLETGELWGPMRLEWPKNRVSPTDLLLLMVTDSRWINRDTFWHPIPGLKLDPNEK